MDEIEEIDTFNGRVGFCNFCGTNVDSFRKLVHIRDDKHREMSSTGFYCYEDKLLQKKGDLLSQTEDEFTAVKEVVLACEKTLKIVSDEFLKKVEEECKKKKEEKDDDDDDDSDDSDSDSSSDDSDSEVKSHAPPKRVLKGVARVGSLANGLMMRGEREVMIVILSEEKPSYKFLNEVHASFASNLQVVNDNSKFTVELKDTYFQVKYSAQDSIQVTCRIEITCAKCRPHPFKQYNEKLLPDPADMLPRSKCEGTLRALRRARWFESKCYSHCHSELMLKIFKDFCRREKDFNLIDDWILQNLFHKVISSPDSSSLNLIGIFQRFFECLSSGILLPDGPGLLDPCEREPSDLRDQLTLQQRLTITTTAQKLLRMIAMKRVPLMIDLAKEDMEMALRKPFTTMKRGFTDTRDDNRRGFNDNRDDNRRGFNDTRDDRRGFSDNRDDSRRAYTDNRDDNKRGYPDSRDDNYPEKRRRRN